MKVLKKMLSKVLNEKMIVARISCQHFDGVIVIVTFVLSSHTCFTYTPLHNDYKCGEGETGDVQLGLVQGEVKLPSRNKYLYNFYAVYSSDSFPRVFPCPFDTYNLA